TPPPARPPAPAATTIPARPPPKPLAVATSATRAPSLAGFTSAEIAIMDEVKATPRAQLRALFEDGGGEIEINGKKISVEPAMPASAMTWFEEDTFTLDREAFVSDAELIKTLLHEKHRLATSRSLASGVSRELATTETNAAA